MSRWQTVRPFVPGAARVLVAAGVAAGLVWAGTTHPFGLDLAAATGGDQVPVSDTALATAVSAMCPGNELTGITGVDDIDVDGTVTAATGPVELLPQEPQGAGEAVLSDRRKERARLEGERPAATSTNIPARGPVALTATGSLAPAVAATEEWLEDGDSLRGLTTTPCLAAGSDLWLLAGGEGAGRLERLVLLNPGGNPVSAAVTIHGSDGQVGDVHTDTVPAGGRTTLLVDAWAPDEQAPAVHVVAGGGGLQATLTDTWLDGSTPRGAETVVATDHAGLVQVVPGAQLGSHATLRIAVPGEEQAVARVAVLGDKGLVPTTADTVLTVAGGSTGELALPSVPAGSYAVRIDSDVPVVASVGTDLGNGSDPGDIAWAASAQRVREVSGAALPATKGVGRTLHLVASGGSATADVTTVEEGVVATKKVRLSADTAVSVQLGGAESVWVQRAAGPGELHGAIVSSTGKGAERLASVMPLEPSAVTSPVARAFPLP
jgi:hypothetical protein